ncbi:MAG: hypothetical protein LUE65_12140 [Clostridiales bacterium]|nr:hypothetical protein [Clostridiales bacterium]
MIHIPLDEDKLEPAKTAHAKAIINYVKSKGATYQQKLYNNIRKLTPNAQNLEDLKQKEDWSWLSDFILADVLTLKSWASDKTLLQFDEFKTIYSTKFCNGATVYVDSRTNYNAYAFCRNLDITVCPYCDEEFLDILESNGKKTVRTMEIDHFYPKSEYPALAMCFFNLVPSGQNCNGIKLKELLGMNPYESNIETCTHLYPDFPIGMNMDKVKVSDCTIKFHPIQGMVQNVTKLRLEERYERHKGIAHKYITNMQFYSNEKIDELVSMGIFSSKEMAYRDLFDISLPDDTDQKLLTKLRRDIVGQ